MNYEKEEDFENYNWLFCRFSNSCHLWRNIPEIFSAEHQSKRFESGSYKRAA
jgi:hypothetical protein